MLKEGLTGLPEISSLLHFQRRILVTTGIIRLEYRHFLRRKRYRSWLGSFKLAAGISAVFIILLTLDPVSASSSSGTMFQYDLAHSGNYSTETDVSANTFESLVPLWSYTTGDRIDSSPVVSNDLVYIGSNDYSLYAFNAITGQLVWTYPTAGVIHSTPAIADGVIYVGSEDHALYALNADSGSLLWSNSTAGAITSSPAVTNSIVYVGSGDGNISAFDAVSGVRIWVNSSDDFGIDSSPAVVDGSLYIGSTNSNMYAYNATTGVKLWNTATGNAIHSSPSMAGGVLYVGSSDWSIHAFDAISGSELWSHSTSGAVTSSPVLVDDVIYVGDNGQYLYALNTDGTRKYRFSAGHSVFSSPAYANGVVYFQDYDEHASTLYALNADSGGILYSNHSISGKSSPSIKNNTLYIGNESGSIYAFKIVRSPVAGFTSDLTSGTSPLNVRFSDTSSNNPLSWVWYFGDESSSATTPWTRMNAGSGWTTRTFPSLVALPDDTLILTGGYDNTDTDRNDSWQSTDAGVSWARVNTSSGWFARYGHSTVTLSDGTLILLGGTDSSYSYFNDTWRSTDKGSTWSKINTSSGWSKRAYMSVVALEDDTLVLMGGSDETSSTNDTWRSTDSGVTWTRVNASCSWEKRSDISSAPLSDGSIVLTGGWTENGVTGDTWRSTDTGATWVLMNASPGWPARADHDCIPLPDGSILLFGGYDGSSYFNDTWRSTDKGATWSRVVMDPGWSARHGQKSAVLSNGNVILTGGYDSNNLYRNDTWQFNAPGSYSQNPAHTYTRAGLYKVSLTVSGLARSSTKTVSGYINVTSVSSPVGAFSGTPTSGTAPLTVSFTDSSTGSPTGWAWFFGDEDYKEPWIEMNASAPWGDRWQQSTVSLSDGSIVMTGGSGPSNDTWLSTDKGATWTLMNASSGWEGRSLHSSVSLPDGRIILMGGFGSRSFLNDTWQSIDAGKTWILVNASSGWSARGYLAGIVAPDGSILLMGGQDSSGNFYNDTWRSTDKGASWTLRNGSSGWSERSNPMSVTAQDGSILLIGGYDGNFTSLNDTWRTTNYGSTWTLVNASAGWSAREAPSAVTMTDGSILLMGGDFRNDTWRTENSGSTWTLVNASPGWEGRYWHNSVVLPDGSVILLGGGLKDVWRFNPAGSSSQNPSHTYTTAGNFTATLQAFNSAGFNSTRKNYYITVNSGSSALVSGFSANPVNGTVPFTVQFNDTSVGSPINWSWDFGDGNTSSLQNPSHTFSWAQVFNVTLTVSGSSGTSNRSLMQITGYAKQVTANTTLNGTSVVSSTGSSQTVAVNQTDIGIGGGSVTNTSTTVTIQGANSFWQTTEFFAEAVSVNASTGDYIAENVTQVVLESTPVDTILPNETIGNVSVSLDIALKQYIPDTSINISITEGATTETIDAFQLAAQNADINISGIAYTVQFTNTGTINSNLTQNSSRSSSAVILTMTVNHSWVSRFANSTNNDGRGSVTIIRYPETGSTTVLTTRFTGYNSSTGIDTFEADSPNGLSIFGMIGYAAQSAASGGSSGSGNSVGSNTGSSGSSGGGGSGGSGSGTSTTTAAGGTGKTTFESQPGPAEPSSQQHSGTVAGAAATSSADSSQQKVKPPSNAFEIIIGLGTWGVGFMLKNLFLTAACAVLTIGVYAGWRRYREKNRYDILFGDRK